MSSTVHLVSAAVAVGAVGALCLYAAMVAVLATKLMRPSRAPHAFSPADYGIEHEEVSFPARHDGLSLAAWHLPAQPARGAVILVHGHNGSKSCDRATDCIGLIRSLLERGLSVLMLDLRGHGASAPAYSTYGLHERLDVLGAVDWLVGRGYRAGCIGVVGASMGGVASIAAAAEERAIAAVVSDSAFADFTHVIESHFARVGRCNVLRPAVWIALALTRRRTGVRMERFRPADFAGRLDGTAVLIVHSRDDDFIGPEHAEALAQATGTQPWISASAGHVETCRALPVEYVDRLAAFLHGVLVSAAPLRQAA